MTLTHGMRKCLEWILELLRGHYEIQQGMADHFAIWISPIPGMQTDRATKFRMDNLRRQFQALP